MEKPFLTEAEKNSIRCSCYKPWVDNANVESLIPQITGHGFTTPRQEEEIRCAKTSYDKNTYFFTNILMRLPRLQFHEFVALLKKDDQHKPFAESFETILGIKPPTTMTAGFSEPAGEVWKEESSTPVQSDIPEKSQCKNVDYYKTKADKEKGIVFIVANFTSGAKALHGYVKDIDNIRVFFGKTLHYDVVTEIGGIKLENLNEKDFRKALTDMKEMVERDKKYDRFYLFVLSHGDDAGIHSSERKSISVKDIIRPFQHDNMPSMKGLPKLFFLQACRGHNYVQAASKADHTSVPQRWEMPAEPIPTEADLMVCYSVTDSNLCFVLPNGSVFITEVLNAFQSYCDSTEDIGVIMREVKHKVSILTVDDFKVREGNAQSIEGDIGRKGQLKNIDTNELIASGDVFSEVARGKRVKCMLVSVQQMSTVTDNLTKKLFFKNPV